MMEVLSEDANAVYLNGLKRRVMSVSKRATMTLICRVDDNGEQQRLMGRSLCLAQRPEAPAQHDELSTSA